MNKFTKEIATILQAKIDSKPYEIEQSGLTLDQIEEITKFATGYIRSGIGWPYPLKQR